MVVHAVDDGIGELYFSACASPLLAQEVEYGWIECVSSDDCEVAGCVFAFWFFDHLIDGDDVWLYGRSGYDAFGVDVVPGGFGDCDDVSAVAVSDIEDLRG